ncbi:MAG TPA: ABC transporter permease subunit [Gryllotalpicola sp.]
MALEMTAAPAETRAKTPRRRKRARSGIRGVAPLRGLLPLAALLAIWQIAQIGRSSVFFPPPSQWVSLTSQLVRDGSLGTATGETLLTFILSLAIATVIGALLGILIGRVALLDRLLGPTLEFLRFLPGVSLVPLAVLFMGYTQSMELYVVVFGAVWPILLQARLAARQIDPLLLDVRATLHLSRPAAFWKIVLPSVAPGVMLGVQIAAPLTLVLVLVVEISTQVAGLGKLLETAQQSFLAAQVFGLIVVVGVIALVINVVLALIERRVLRYRPPQG